MCRRLSVAEKRDSVAERVTCRGIEGVLFTRADIVGKLAAELICRHSRVG